MANAEEIVREVESFYRGYIDAFNREDVDQVCAHVVILIRERCCHACGLATIAGKSRVRPEGDPKETPRGSPRVQGHAL